MGFNVQENVMEKPSVPGYWVVFKNDGMPMDMGWTAVFHWNEKGNPSQDLGFYAQTEAEIVSYLREKGFWFASEMVSTALECNLIWTGPEEMHDSVADWIAGDIETFYIEKNRVRRGGEYDYYMRVFFLGSEEDWNKLVEIAERIALLFEDDVLEIYCHEVETFRPNPGQKREDFSHMLRDEPQENVGKIIPISRRNSPGKVEVSGPLL